MAGQDEQKVLDVIFHSVPDSFNRGWGRRISRKRVRSVPWQVNCLDRSTSLSDRPMTARNGWTTGRNLEKRRAVG